jgi:hypothetical protein
VQGGLHGTGRRADSLGHFLERETEGVLQHHRRAFLGRKLRQQGARRLAGSSQRGFDGTMSSASQGDRVR